MKKTTDHKVVLNVQPHALKNGSTTVTTTITPFVTKVALYKEISAGGAPAIAAGFKDTGVTSVDLTKNYIGADAPATAAAFKDTGVTSVNLGWNRIGADAPATAAAFKDTGVTSVNLIHNGTTFKQDLECLDIIWDQGQIYNLGIDHKKECSVYLNDHIKTVVHTEFTQPFPDVMQGLIGAYADILNFDM
jgi:hypothetical protein